VRELAHQFGLTPRPEPTTAADDHAASSAAFSAAFSAASAAAPAGGTDVDSAGTAAEDEHDARFAALHDAERAAAEDLMTACAAADRATGTDATDGSATRAALTRLLDTRRLIDTALAERPRIAVVDQLSGTLLALTDSTELRAAVAAGRGLGPPSGTDA